MTTGVAYDWRETGYTVTVFSTPLFCVFAIGALFITVGAFLGADSSVTDRAVFWMIGGICVIAATPLMSLRLLVNDRGVRVSSAILGLTLKFVPAQMIQGVQFGSVSPSEWGGWGLRFRRGSLGFILGGSDGLVVYCKDLTKLAVSVPQAKFPAAVRESAEN